MDAFFSAMGFNSEEVPEPAADLSTQPGEGGMQRQESGGKLHFSYETQKVGIAYGQKPPEGAPAESAPAESAPAESPPAEAPPAAAPPAEAPPVEAPSAEAPLADAPPAEASPSQALPTEAAPTEATGPPETADSSPVTAGPRSTRFVEPSPIAEPPEAAESKPVHAGPRSARFVEPGPVTVTEPSAPEAAPAEVTQEPAALASDPTPVMGLSPHELGVASNEAVSPVMGLSPHELGVTAPSVKLESALLTPEPAAAADASATLAGMEIFSNLASAEAVTQASPPQAPPAEAAPVQAAPAAASAEVASTALASPDTSSSAKPEVPLPAAAFPAADSKGAQQATSTSNVRAAPAQPAPRRPVTTPPAAGSPAWRTWVGKSGQTSAYQRLGTSEEKPTALTAHAAVSEPSSEPVSAATPSFSKAPAPSARHTCGMARQRLRNEYNRKEINAALLLQKFDVNGNGVLEPDEFRQLLKSWMSDQGFMSTSVSDDDLKYIMAVADKSHDDRISADEILHALQAWYSFNSMPCEVNAGLCRKYGIYTDGSPLPSVETLQQILVDLNGFQCVEREEAIFVRQLAKNLGATEEKVTLLQLRRAIAIWYINVERGRTDTRSLVEDAVTTLAAYTHHHGKRMMGQVPSAQAVHRRVAVHVPMIKQIWQDETAADLEGGTGPESFVEDEVVPVPVLWAQGFGDELSCCLPLTFWTVLLLLPSFFMMHVAMDYPPFASCEHDLGSLLLWKGLLALVVGCCGLFYNTMHDGVFQTFCFYGGIAVSVVALLQELVGVTMTLNSSPEKCGDYIWNVNAFFFVWVLLWGPALCCCLVFCFSTLAIASVAHDRREMESSLHPDKESSDSAYSALRDDFNHE